MHRTLAEAEVSAVIARVDRKRQLVLTMRLLAAFLAGLGVGLLIK